MLRVSGQTSEEKAREFLAEYDLEGLTKKQIEFVMEYVTSWNATTAAKKAGYASPWRQSGHRTKNLPKIREIIEAERAKIGMGSSEVIVILSEIARGKKVNAALSALDKLARIHGMYTDNARVSGELTIRVEYADDADRADA